MKTWHYILTSLWRLIYKFSWATPFPKTFCTAFLYSWKLPGTDPILSLPYSCGWTQQLIEPPRISVSLLDLLNLHQPIPLLLALTAWISLDSFLSPFLTFLSALCAWVPLSHALWLQLQSPVSPLTKYPQDTAIINCLPCLGQGTFLWGQTPY